MNEIPEYYTILFGRERRFKRWNAKLGLRNKFD